MEGSDVEMLSASLVREYLARKRLVSTLRQLDEEQSQYSTCIRNRLKLMKALRIGKLIKRNKKQNFALDSMVEIIVHFLLGHARDSREKTKVLQGDHQYEHTEDYHVKLFRNEGFPHKNLYQEEASIVEANAEEAFDEKAACDKVEGISLIGENTEQKKMSVTKDPDLFNHDLRGNTSIVSVPGSVSKNIASNIARCDNDQGSQSDARQQYHETILLCDTEKQYDKEQLSDLELLKNSDNEIQIICKLRKDLVSNKSDEEGSKTQRRCSLLNMSAVNGVLTRENSVIYHHGSSLEESEMDSASDSCASVIDLLKDECWDNTVTADIFRKESAVVRKNYSAKSKVSFAQMERCKNVDMERRAYQILDTEELEKSKEETEEMEKWASERPEKYDRYSEVTVENWEKGNKEEPDVLQLLSEEEEVRVIFDSEERPLTSHSWQDGTADNPQYTHTLRAVAGKTRKSCLGPGWADDAGDDIETCEPCPEDTTRGDQCADGVEDDDDDDDDDDVSYQSWERADVHLCSVPTPCEGFAYMVVAVDLSTDRLEAAPLKTLSPKSLAKYLLKLIYRRGCEVKIHDQEHEFVESVSTHLHIMMGRRQRLNGGRHSRQNRLTESNYKTLRNSILKLLNESPDKRPRSLPGGLFVYHLGKQKSKGFTPPFFLCGRQAGLTTQCEDEAGDRGESIGSIEIMDEAVSEMKKCLAASKKLAFLTYKGMSNILSQEHQTSACQKRHRAKSYDVGDTVLWNLRRPPYTIQAELDDDTYELKALDGTILKQKALGVNLNTYNKRMSADPVKEKRLEEEETVNIVSVTDAPQSKFQFDPTSSAWRTYHAYRLNLPKPKNMEEREPKATLTSPQSMDAIKGDGNCFFRAMSLELSGTQSYHMRLRKAVVAYLSAGDNRWRFSMYSGEMIEEYLANSGMAKYGTWATDVEIVAMATMLQTTIFVYSEVNGTRKWLPYKPLFEAREVQKYKQCVYLSNLDLHFERVLSCS